MLETCVKPNYNENTKQFLPVWNCVTKFPVLQSFTDNASGFHVKHSRKGYHNHPCLRHPLDSS